jgi:5-formyltetrahydrofolate cyclo-ligase
MDKVSARKLVWEKLKHVAIPDSRFHLDFNQFIPDFNGSDVARTKLVDLNLYKSANTVFVTPDNCLEGLREQMVLDGKTQVMPTYGIRRGFVILSPEDVGEGMTRYSVSLDHIEKVGKYIDLSGIRDNYKLDLLVTGASAVNYSGVRFGKGHGFFDLEWAMLYQIGAVVDSTPVISFVHDCQLVDVDLEVDEFDTVCDYIVTPNHVVHVEGRRKPTAGIIWDKLSDGMMNDIPPLQELKLIDP